MTRLLTNLRETTALRRLLAGAALGAAAFCAPAFAQTAAAPEAPAAALTEGQRGAAEAAARLAEGLATGRPGAETDDPVILEAPEPNARRVYVNDPAHFAAITQQFVIDGDSGRILGMIDGGFLPNPVVASDGSFFAQASTVFKRVARGQREDYVEVFDARTHYPIADITLPEEPRMLVGTYPWMTALTPDDKTLLFYRFSPSPSVGVVDLEAKEYRGIFDVPDCYHIFPVSADTFYMHCRAGTMAKITMGEGEPQISESEVFHTEEEYLINHPAYSPKSGRLVWPAYDGKLFQVDLTTEGAKFLPPLQTFTDAEKAEGWALGGWQQAAYHRPSDRIYILADQRAQWRHKTSSRFVFVVDARTGQRIKRIDLGYEADSINVSQDSPHQLYVLSTGEKAMRVLDPETGAVLHRIDQLGHGPQVITTADY
ncbi:methylamine dehydrogenase (amicyanin) large subunit [Neomegalonema sp.]|uniref:methylamine dehydrogenase (amicyanin) large subunit n=1 Tax=Neomegalonema sp. TaxID=2039713 RepID=UPI00260A094D|nr:methylamine dehydrogenase (amicyanin) large subunit [Neomegalonema sp.]MDD2867345.1 methylamine dehydrogenase (amicyanin) large subunit [Neomegalonema sp.]